MSVVRYARNLLNEHDDIGDVLKDVSERFIKGFYSKRTGKVALALAGSGLMVLMGCASQTDKMEAKYMEIVKSKGSRISGGGPFYHIKDTLELGDHIGVALDLGINITPDLGINIEDIKYNPEINPEITNCMLVFFRSDPLPSDGKVGKKELLADISDTWEEGWGNVDYVGIYLGLEDGSVGRISFDKKYLQKNPELGEKYTKMFLTIVDKFHEKATGKDLARERAEEFERALGIE